MEISIKFPNDKEAFSFLAEMESRFRLDRDVWVELHTCCFHECYSCAALEG